LHIIRYIPLLFLLVLLTGTLSGFKPGDPPAAVRTDLDVNDTAEATDDNPALSADTSGPATTAIAATDPPAKKTTVEPDHDEEGHVHGDEEEDDFDTTSVHMEKFDALTFNDTVMLLLNDPQHCGYVHPFNGYVTSNFGFRKSRYHFGVDIKLNTGDSVVSCFDGKVRIAQYSKTYGNLVVVRHSNGLETYYAHLSKLLVKVGDEVEAGTLVGLGGNTGRSFGAHLHFEVRYKGQPINPNYIIDFEKKCIRTNAYPLCKSDFKYLSETHKVVRRSRKSKKTYVTYYTPGGPKYATKEAKAIMATVPEPVMPNTDPNLVPDGSKTPIQVKPQPTPSASNPNTGVKPAPNGKTTSPPANKSGAGTKTYVVKKGDTLGAIAARNNTTVDKLCQLNGIKKTSILKIGQKLRVK